MISNKWNNYPKPKLVISVATVVFSAILSTVFVGCAQDTPIQNGDSNDPKEKSLRAIGVWFRTGWAVELTTFPALRVIRPVVFHLFKPPQKKNDQNTQVATFIDCNDSLVNR